MNIAEIFIRRPVMTTLVMLGILLFGIFSYRLLPVSNLPNVDFPTIQVSASLPGANPETMASAVATPLEKQFSTIAGLDSMSSSSSLGSTQITIQFDLSRDIDAAAQDVQAAIAKASRSLPQDMPNPPSYSKVNPADQPIVYLVLYSPTLPLSKVDDYAETIIAQRLSTVNGVAQVQVYGAQKYAVRIQLDPEAMAARGIGIDEVSNAIKQNNVNLPTGNLSGEHKNYNVQTNGQLMNADSYRSLIVTYRNGSPVYLNEIGQVIDSVENNKTASWFNNEARSITLAIQRQPGTNTVAVADEIKKLLPTFREQLPASVQLELLYDRSESIRASVDDVEFTLFLAICLVVLVIFIFLRNFSATIIPSLAVPMSLVATFALMYVLGYSLDNLSLMALTLSVGFVVDDAIVVLENIVRRMEMGEKRMQAALNGTKEIGFTIISMTISLVAVFIPILFMGGIIGRLFREFAVTISASILVSGLISLSLTPMLCSRFLRPPHTDKPNRLYKISEQFFDGMLGIYRWSLQRVIRFRKTTMIVSLAIFLATGFLFNTVNKGFIPSEDTGQLSASTEAAQDISFDDMVRHQQALANIVRKSPYIEAFSSSVGGGASSTTNSGRIFMRLKPRSERPSVDEVIQDLRKKINRVPGIQAFLQNPPPIRIGGQSSKSLYQLTLQSIDTDVLYQYVPELLTKLQEIPDLQDVTSDWQLKNLQVKIEIDREQAATQGISIEQVQNTLRSAYSSAEVSSIYAPNDEYSVILELEPQYQRNPEELSLLYVHSANNQLIPLESIAKITQGVGPLTVNHTGQLPSVTISFNLKPGVSLNKGLEIVQNTAKEILPASILTNFQGNAQVFASSFQGMGWLLVVAILVIYIVLGILYEDFIHPLTILSGLPSAGFGALLTLMIFQVDLDIYAFVGIILLVGIVKKNGIMMVDFAIESQKNEGKKPIDAIYEACLVRFRPIMMTTMAALMGTLPIALGFGAGGEARRSLGLAVVGGLLFSQLLTLYITPVFYIYMEKMRSRFSDRKPQPTQITLIPEKEPINNK
ncbi:efflux RND transporter permease subunit [Phormidium sp. LEGE 05292]|uniref:efflux RND transporter permease subunit n=1 Tax=[Phormidium] sp. LEGE 05292 TaxID=767427 RepID=UPI001881A7F6|nr:multidrug efflux RND transporter permease subunit [Phormidium sp. LEGE 05292]MBE9229262.1 efflux RND transporter permease subunit [Phormidium sp. LEGE 05292]